MIYVFLVDNHETVEALTIVDLLRRAKLNVLTVSLTNSLEVISSVNIKVYADILFNDISLNNIDALILPGGPGTNSYLEHKDLCNLLIKEYNNNTLLAAICAAPIIFSKLNINVNSTIYPTYKDQIKYYNNTNVCIDNNIITGESLAASIDFTLEIIRYLTNDTIVNEVSNSIIKRY